LFNLIAQNVFFNEKKGVFMFLKPVIIVLFCAIVAFSQRIVSLAPPATNQLVALGSDSLLVGRTSFCLGGENASVIGDVMNISGESIMALNPDIVIAGGLTNASLIERLRRANVNVLVILDPKNYEELRENFRKIAEIANVLPKADSILAITDKRLSQMIEENKAIENRPIIFVQLSANPIFTIMRNTLGNEMIEGAGGQNAFNLEGGAMVSAEAVVAANPDIIIIADMERMSRNEIRRWSRFRNMSAIRSNAIYIIDGYAIGSPTPVSFIETVEKIRGKINRN